MKRLCVLTLFILSISTSVIAQQNPPSKEQFPRMAPPAKSSNRAKRGFEGFQKYCLKCHAINGEGGKLGPELNYPVNVTEYFRENYLKRWILDPETVRSPTTMPPLDKTLAHRDKVADDIISYLKVMVRNKTRP